MLALIITMILTFNTHINGAISENQSLSRITDNSGQLEAEHTSGRDLRRELKEYRNFKKKVNRYKRGIKNMRKKRLKRLRNEILADMRSEIDQTKVKIRSFRITAGYKGSKRSEGRNRAELYSKRSRLYNRYRAEILAHELRKTERMLREQQKLYSKLSRLNFRKGYNGKHQLLLSQYYMDEFAGLLKQEINGMKEQRHPRRSHTVRRNH